jgi:hypothetical protein
MKAKTFQHFGAASFWVLLAACLLVPAAGAQQFSEWSAPVNLNQLPNQTTPINTAFDDQHMAISKDGLSLFFASNRTPGCGDFDIWVTERASVDSPWEEPVNLDASSLAQGLGCKINSSVRDFAPNLSTDGHLLSFHSFRANDNCGGGDIYYTHRKDRRDDLGWEAPRNLNRFGRDPEASLICGGIGDLNLVNTPNTDAGPNHFQDEATGTTVLYFTRSDQPTQVGDFDIYTATLGADGTWGTVVRDNELSTTPFRDTRTAIRRRDGLEMILSSERPGGLGSPARDLWVSTRASTLDPWSIPVLLPNVNTTALEGAPALSWDATELYFFSARAGGAGGTDIYRSTRTKITGQ